MTKTFILGAGTQKAGTTWLNEYLRTRPNVVLGPRKEYHIWDVLYVRGAKDTRIKQINPNTPLRTRVRFEMLENEESYFEFFADLLNQSDADLTADITPTYAGLPASVFKKIINGFAARDIDVKTVFLMRDPVERCWSALKMTQRVRGKTEAVPNDRMLLNAAKSRAAIIRTRYDRTITRLERAFAADNIHVGIYEEMFTRDRIEGLSNFLGVEPDFTFVEKKFNAATTSAPLDPDVAREVAVFYRDVYDFAAEYCPAVRSLWSGFQYL